MANKEALDNLFPQDVRNAIANYVKAGGNVYVSTYAARLAHPIGRAPEPPNVFSEDNGFGVGNDEWKVLADFGSDHVNHTHAIYNYLIANNLYDQKSNGLIKKHYLIQPLIQRLGVFFTLPLSKAPTMH